MTRQTLLPFVLLAIAAVITIALFMIDFFFGAMAVVVLVILVMSIRIMGETTHYPDVVASLPETARSIILTNRGNEAAEEIHVTLVPQNLDFNLPSLAPDATHQIALPQMVEKVKVVLTYTNQKGQPISRTYTLSSVEGSPGEEDLLQPLFPLFGWK